MDEVEQIANAVLYEGYILWPYGRSALKNQKRWTFGGVYPKPHSATHPDDPCELVTECLLEGSADSSVEVQLRFLQVVRRQPARVVGAELEYVDELTAGGERYLSWDEATEREVRQGQLTLGGLAEHPRRLPIAVDAATDTERLVGKPSEPQGVLVRSWKALCGEMEIGAVRLARGLYRLRVAVVNTTGCEAQSRDEVVFHTFVSTHVVFRAGGAKFVSLTDPPDRLCRAAEGCQNAGWWPVLVGAKGERHTLLSAPIIMCDYPRVAPESPGDLFDGAEIDQLLILNILALTDEEKAEMRASDPRAREILDRVAGLSEQELMRLHGAIREFQAVRR